MEIAIAGGHGKIALLLEPMLAGRGHAVRALIRNQDHAGEIEATGATPVVADLEALEPDALAEHLDGVEAIIYAAGAGSGSGPERKWSMDYGGAVKLIEVARGRGIHRFVMISAAGADPYAADDGGFSTYLLAKGKADAELMHSGLAYTIIKPVGLTDEAGTGRISTDPTSGSRQIPRADVAATIAAVLDAPGSEGASLVVRSGPTPIPAALALLSTARRSDPRPSA
jgi:uncharacterized protein YbjT (DUF2867 family)